MGDPARTIDILMESTPADVNLDALMADIRPVEGVQDFDDLHVWSMARSMRTLSAHVVTNDLSLSAGAWIQGVDQPAPGRPVRDLARHPATRNPGLPVLPTQLRYARLKTIFKNIPIRYRMGDVFNEN